MSNTIELDTPKVKARSEINLSKVLTSFDPPPKFIVDGLVYQQQLVTMAGEAGVGKSYLMYSMAACIAAGIDFLGFPCVQGPVLYFDEENGTQDLHQYLRWTWRGLGCPSVDLLTENLHVDHFALSIYSKPEERYKYMALRARDIKPVLIVVDTATPACGIEDENSNAEATRAIIGLRAVKAAAGDQAAMVVLKHAKIDDVGQTISVRGAKAWIGASDAILYHRPSAGHPRTDGLRNSIIHPGKIRAFGLRHPFTVYPSWCQEGEGKGIALSLTKPYEDHKAKD